MKIKTITFLHFFQIYFGYSNETYNIAWGKGHLVHEYDLKWSWPWEMAAIF